MLAQSHTTGSSLFSDAKLPQLATLMDVSAMAGHFTRYLRASGMEPGWEVAQCGIEKVYYRHTKSCGILYRLRLRHASGAEADEWFFGRTRPAGHNDERFHHAVSAVDQIRTPHDFLRAVPPVSWWHDFNMILWVFPQDPKLATLSQVVDPAFVRQQVEANLRAFGVPANGANAGSPGWRCAGIRYDRVKYMPGKRCVLRYHVNLAGPAGASREVIFYCKVYNDSMSRYHFDMLRLIYEQLTARTATVNIPKPLLYHDGLNTFWQEEWKGKALLDVIFEFDWQELFQRIATVLAAMHRQRVEGLRPAPNPDEILTAVAEDEAKLVKILPQQQPLTTAILEQLQAMKGVLERQDIPAVPIHGACRVEQMLIRGHELALVDFDAVTLGDPLYDIAEFIASLQYLELSRGFPRERLAQAVARFYDSYAAQVPWPCDRRRLAWYALAFLITKMYSSAKNLDRQALQQLDSAGKEICEEWLETIG